MQAWPIFYRHLRRLLSLLLALYFVNLCGLPVMSTQAHEILNEPRKQQNSLTHPLGARRLVLRGWAIFRTSKAVSEIAVTTSRQMTSGYFTWADDDAFAIQFASCLHTFQSIDSNGFELGFGRATACTKAWDAGTKWCRGRHRQFCAGKIRESRNWSNWNWSSWFRWGHIRSAEPEHTDHAEVLYIRAILDPWGLLLL